MHDFYNAVKNIYGPITRRITSLKTADGLTLLKDQNSILSKACEHFDTLLNQNSPPSTTSVYRQPYRYMCIRTLYQHITKAWTDENSPQQWRDANIVIYKNKGE